MSDPPGALAGCRVIEAARFVTGPFASQMLADLGADVIKIEDPEGGDPFRGWGKAGYAPPFLAFNRSKRSLTLDLRQAASGDIVRRLVRGADVFIENFRPGVAEKLGVDGAAVCALNPRLVHCSITGMGADGPYAARPSYDIVGQGLSGLLGLLVEPDDPRPMGPTFSDSLTGLYAAYGILAALQARERTGRGQRVETSQLQATMGFMHEPYSQLFASGRSPDPYSRPRASQVYAFTCSDGLALAVHLSSPEKFWRAFATAAGQAAMIDDPRYARHADRQVHWAEIHAHLKPVFAAKPRDAWLDALHRADVPVAPIYRLDEVVNDPQVRHLDMVKPLTHPERGALSVLGFPVRLEATPLGPLTPPPTLGENSDQILAEIGYAPAEIARLRASGTV
jgi:formyl-CoA transferase